MRYIEITKKNIELATKVQMSIFPRECAYEHFKHTIDVPKDYNKFFTIM